VTDHYAEAVFSELELVGQLGGAEPLGSGMLENPDVGGFRSSQPAAATPE